MLGYKIICVVCTLLLLAPAVVLSAGDLVVYSGQTGTIASGWENFSWAKVTLTDVTTVKPGDKYSASMVCTGWQGFYLAQINPWDASPYNTFSFWINGGASASSVVITVTLTATNNSETLSIKDYAPNHELPANTWVQIQIPISSFGLKTTEIKGFWFQANGPDAPVVYFDDIEFTTSIVPPVPGPALQVNATSGIHISEGIYGVSIWWSGGATDADYVQFAKEISLPLNRIGGDSTTRYNWQVDSSNAGADWFFMGGNGNASFTPGLLYDNFIKQNSALQIVTTVTIPMIQYINKESAWHCSFPVSVYGNQSSVNPYIHPNGDNCGNGEDPKGNKIVDKNPLATDVPNTPEIQKQFVQHIVSKWGNSAKSRIIYQLDNEVSNWAYMHRDVHPQPVTYSEIVNQTIIYASAVKQADPTAMIAAPSEIQFAWYPDWGASKNTIFFLEQIKAYEVQTKSIIVDTYDVHYPDANDNHWPILTDVGRLRQVVDQTYPGKGISFSEWTLAGLGPMNGALAIADELGHFAANQVSWASIWGLNPADLTGPVSFGLRMYRNYDGMGSMFGDNYVKSSTADDSKVSVHAAIRSKDNTLTILVINKESVGQTCSLSLSGFKPSSTSAKVYQASGSSITTLPTLTVSASGFSTTFAPYSLTMVVIH